MASPRKKWLRLKAAEDVIAEELLAMAAAVAGRVDTTAAAATTAHMAHTTAPKTTTRAKRTR